MKKILSLSMMGVVLSSSSPISGFSQESINSKNIYQQLNLRNQNDDFLGPKVVLDNNLNNIQDFGNQSAITSKGIIFVIADQGLYESSDFGFSYQENIKFKNEYVNSLYIDNKDDIYVDSISGLYESVDNGLTFSLLNNFDNKGYAFDNIVIFQNNLYISDSISNTGVFKSSDNGITFTKVLNYNSNPLTSNFLVAKNYLIVYTTNNVYITDGQKVFKNIFKSSDPNGIIANVFFDNINNNFYFLESFNDVILGHYGVIFSSSLKKYDDIKQVAKFSNGPLETMFSDNNNYWLMSSNHKGTIFEKINIKTWKIEEKFVFSGISGYNFKTLSNNGLIYYVFSKGTIVFNTPYLLLNSISAPYTYDSSKNQFDLKGNNNLSVNWNMLDMVSVNGQMVDNTQTSIKLSKGENHLTLMLNDTYSKYANIFGASGAEIDYTFFVS